MKKSKPLAARIVKPSHFPDLEIEFYHMGKILVISKEKAKIMVEDMTWAINEVEKNKL